MRAWHGIGRTDFTVVVSGGTGYLDINITGRIVLVIVTAPSGSPDMSYVITDVNSRGICANGPRTGSENTWHEDETPCYGKNRVTLNCSLDGSYTVTLYGLVQGGDWLVSSPT